MNIKKIKMTALSLFLLLSATATPLYAYSYYLWDDYGGTYSDAEKNPDNTEDDLMCWAAAASNVLAWTGWGAVIGSADDIFSYYQDHWTDNGGNPYYAWEWWFNGINSSQGEPGYSQVDSDGGGFWSATYRYEDYVWSTRWSGEDSLAMENIYDLLTSGYGTVLSVTNNASGHALTCWGYEIDSNGDYVGVYVTDSDDDKTLTNPDDELVYYEILLSGSQWYLQDFYGSDTWYITEVQGLSGMPVPLPASVFLFGCGLCIASFFGRRQVAEKISLI